MDLNSLGISCLINGCTDILNTVISKLLAQTAISLCFACIAIPQVESLLLINGLSELRGSDSHVIFRGSLL
jgi:hypothetical protein